MTLTEQQIVDLRWMVKANDQGKCGLFGPSVKRHGPIESCEKLCEWGFAERDRWRQGGYWITDAGRAALKSIGRYPVREQTE